MDIRKEILKEHSKKNSLKIANWVENDRRRFDELMGLFLHDEYRVVQRSSWIVKMVADERPEWINSYIKEMLEYCLTPVHNAVKRNVIRILQEIKIPKAIQGLAATVCFDFLSSPEEPVAVKVFSMTVLANIALEEPDMKNELMSIIGEQMEFGTPGFKSRGKKILAMLENQIINRDKKAKGK